MRQEIIWYPTLLDVKQLLPDIDIGAYDVDIGASHRQVFVWMNYIYIGAYDIDI